MSTFLIETSEEDSITAVAGQISELLNEGQEKTALAETPGSIFLKQCTTLAAENRNAELLEIFLKHVETVFNLVSGKDLDCILLVICNLVPKLPVDQQETAVAKSVSSLIGSSGDKKLACLTALVELYNVTFDPTARFSVLIEIIKFARESGLQGEVGPIVKGKASDWAKEWKLSTEDTRKLFLETASLLKALKTKAADQEAFELRVKCLATYEGAPEAEVSSVRAVAAEAAVQFIQSMDIFKCDLCEMSALKQLESDPERHGVFQLLTTMVSGDVKGLQSQASDFAGVLASCGVSMEDAVVKTRLMALLSLGSEQGPASPVAYEEVRERLQVADEEVEQWVVMAIGRKLVDAKINQPERRVQITRCLQRSFGPAQWVQLKSQLEAWRANLAGVSEVVSASQAQALGMQA